MALGSAMIAESKRSFNVKPFFEQSITFLPPRRCDRETARARRPLRSFSTSSPRPFQKRPMKPAYRASSMCRKTLTTEIQSGTSNVSTSDSSPLPYSLSAPQPARKTQRICPMEQSNLAKRAAPCRVRFPAHLAKNTGRAHARWWWRTGRSCSMRSAERLRVLTDRP